MRLENYGMADECIKVYDPIKKEVIAVYETYTKAARELGISDSVLKRAVQTKTRKFSPVLKKEVAVRIASKLKTKQ